MTPAKVVRKPKKITRVAKPPAKVAAKRPAGRPAAKKVPAKKAATKTASKKVTVVGREREVDPITGFTIGTDQQIIADALMEGAETRGDIIAALRKRLAPTTRNGTEKPIANLVSSVYNRLALLGFTLESSWKLLPPTPASKRKATRLANKKSA